ncbi:MerR family DNA-binding transcriptional regulator [Niallia circulans]|uniref:MerR family DNA-binding transcriptional regulator n=1 Tax=Niallia circulans TaxID=1397 RepID=UPI00203DA651|nr:MerR family DNA-binding transcriptional regulator [Niallia circulans]MCM2982382.1 MerR family DNA-binding transcriptional regulator [Niallia circulans]
MNYCYISETSAKFNIPESTIRYYEKQGLLPSIEPNEAGRRLFLENKMALFETVIC